MQIRPETPDDFTAIRAVHDLAYADPRVNRLVDGLRNAGDRFEPLGFVACIDDEVVGHVMCSWSLLDAPARLVDVATLSPLAVLPAFQRNGVATRLIERAIAAVDALDIPLLFLEGDPAFYVKRGFVPATPLGFRSPSLRIPEAAFQVMKLTAYEPWMTGTFVYAQTFWDLDCVGLRGESVGE
jgi:putative acetyltransferase